MSLKTKKSLKTKIKQTENSKQQEEIIAKKAPEIEPGLVSVALSTEELLTFANLMSITAKTFENLAMQAAKDNDNNAFTIMSARYKLSSFYATKLAESLKIPEPVSRDYH